MKNMKALVILLITVLLIIFVAGCTSKDTQKNITTSSSASDASKDDATVSQTVTEKTPIETTEVSTSSESDNKDKLTTEDIEKADKLLSSMVKITPKEVDPDVKDVVVMCNDPDISVEKIKFFDGRKNEDSTAWYYTITIKNKGNEPVYYSLIQKYNGTYDDIKSLDNLDDDRIRYLRCDENVSTDAIIFGEKLQEFDFNEAPLYIVVHKVGLTETSPDFNGFIKQTELMDKNIAKSYEDKYICYPESISSCDYYINLFAKEQASKARRYHTGLDAPTYFYPAGYKYVNIYSLENVTVNEEEGWYSMRLTVGSDTDMTVRIQIDEYSTSEEIKLPANEKVKVELPLNKHRGEAVGCITIYELSIN